ncbi:MAG: branched-chain amino acid ABC transporter permease [Lachnospiraceae bacterium]|nr:branched-chain amino acid ABC transporter permease [Lachnospiraceae bacterium]
MKKRSPAVLSFSIVIVLYIIFEVLLKTGNLSSLMISLLIPVCCYMTAAIGLNLNVGISGELNLGQAGFMSIGAFTGICVSGVLASVTGNGVVRLVIAILCGMVIAALFGILIGIPTLKLSGDYLAIVTLAFGEIIKSLVTNMYLGFDVSGLHFSFVQNNVTLEPGGKMLLNGAMGATSTEKIASFTAGAVLVLISLAVVYNLMDSKSGRAIMAARDNRIAASSIGINVTGVKMLAFVTSAALAGAAGALYGLNFSTLVPSKFDFNLSIMILVYVVLGGLGNMTGTIIATTLLVVLPQVLRSLSEYRMLIYAVVLIAIMLITNNEKLKTDFAKTKLVERFRLRRDKGGAGHGE